MATRLSQISYRSSSMGFSSISNPYFFVAADVPAKDGLHYRLYSYMRGRRFYYAMTLREHGTFTEVWVYRRLYRGYLCTAVL